MRRRIENRLWLLLSLLLLFIVIGEHTLIQKSVQNRLDDTYGVSDAFRKQALSEEMLTYLQNSRQSPGKSVGLYLLETESGKRSFGGKYCDSEFEKLEEKWKQQTDYASYQEMCEQLWDDVKYFPVPESSNNRLATVSYTDSWMYDRNYREESAHEGTDLMADINKRGYYLVVSMTDGVVTNLGWLELGGYRVGITAPGGAYFYYAHLSSYANLKEGMKIKAGDVLGFMGDSGYGKEEGTVGKFPVHLHLGIYLYPDDEEISYNPYWILRYAEKCRVKCEYYLSM